jgi:hypothetical protein
LFTTSKLAPSITDGALILIDTGIATVNYSILQLTLWMELAVPSFVFTLAACGCENGLLRAG